MEINFFNEPCMILAKYLKSARTFWVDLLAKHGYDAAGIYPQETRRSFTRYSYFMALILL